jgi:hypothetical protein
MGPNAEGSPMNGIFLCTAIALNIFSMPAGNTVVGQVPYGKAVQIQDTSLMRDWVFIGKPADGLPSPRGWVLYSGLGYCPNVPNAPEPEGGS